MPSYNWLYLQDIIFLHSSDGKSKSVTGAEIYQAEFKNKLPHQEVTTTPSFDLKEISFSKYPLELSIRIEPPCNPKQGVLICKVYGAIDDALIEVVNPATRDADHIIYNQTWYPFICGALDEIKTIYQELVIPDSGEISLKQYFTLLGKRGGYPEIQDLSGNAASAARIKAPAIQDVIPGFIGKMYPYQSDGFKWLSMISQQGLGCILADQMGLGKTIQVVALLAAECAEKRNRNLVIAPATLLENWRREIAKFTTSLEILIHQGAMRTGFPKHLQDYDVVIISYETIVRDMSMFQLVDWNIVILDEAQAIKNPNAQRTRSVKKLPKRVPIAVTGTPVENRLTDLWSLMDFAMPDLLGPVEKFIADYEDDEDSAARLEPLISPLMLRRKVTEVAKDLPDRIDIPQPIEMDESSISMYEQIRQDTQKEYGATASLVSIQRLRMFCTHPQITDYPVTPDLRRASNKYIRLLEILYEVFQNGEKAIIFTSYNEMISLLNSDLPKQFGSIYIDYINGSVETTERQPKVDKFTESDGPGVLVLNPRAAGTGLNITAANHVIHFNPEWNPALEDQASARAYRRGQTKTVTIHRLFYMNTVEEVICERLDRKRALADTAVVGINGEDDELGDLMKALQRSPKIIKEK